MKKLEIKLTKSSIIIFLASIFFITKVIRTFSGVVGESGGVWNLIQIGFVMLGVLWAIKYFPLCYDNGPIVIMLLLNAYMFIRAITSINFTVSSMYSYLMIPYAVSVLIIFYVVGMRVDVRKRSLLYYTFYVITVIVIFTMIRFLSGGSRASFVKLIDVADVYFSLGLLPLAFIQVSKKYQFVPVLLAALALIFSEKRAGILALIGMVLVLYLINSNKDIIKESFKKIIILVLVVIGMYLLARYFDEHFNLKLFYRLSRMSEDGGSGRLTRWDGVTDAIKNSYVMDVLFGHGRGSVSDLLGGHAHNDFLELFYEYGLIAFLLYCGFYVSLVVKLKKMLAFKYEFSAAFTACIICSFFISMFSFYIIKPTYITCGMLCYGLFLSDFEKQKKK